jgi:nucleoside phosphorylase
MPQKLDYLIFSAEKRELSNLLKKSQSINDRVFLQEINNYKILIIITGVGKNSIKKTLKYQKNIIDKYEYIKVFNIGNAGALKSLFFGTILNIGNCKGENGKENIILDNTNHIENVTVNSLQNKRNLIKQFPNAYTVDMELFHLAKVYPNIISYKIVIDKINQSTNSLFFKLFLTYKVKKNSKKLYNFFIRKYCS